MRILIFSVLLLTASQSVADDLNVRNIVESHILPGYQTLADNSAALAGFASQDCASGNPLLVTAYHDAFDAWISVSHLRFGPSEQDDRAFTLAFWPDPRGAAPKALAQLIQDQDPVVSSPEDFKTVSIAAKGFYALEFLLFDPQFAEASVYHCSLVQAVTSEIAASAAAILDDWQGGYGDMMTDPGNGNDAYRSNDESARQLFTALTTGLAFTSDARLGRPMGTFKRPRPNRAEARRSGRSLRHVLLSLESTRELARMISRGDEEIDRAFEAAIKQAERLDDPVFANVSQPQGRLKVEVLQQSINTIRRLLAEKTGPSLGIAAGFNSMDGD